MLPDDDATPVFNVTPQDLFAKAAVDLRDAILIRAQQFYRQNEIEKSERCYRLAKDVQVVVDAARAADPAHPSTTEYRLDSDVLDSLRDRARLLGVVIP